MDLAIRAIPARFLLLSENLIRESVEIRARALRRYFFEHLILHFHSLKILINLKLTIFCFQHFCIVSFLSGAPLTKEFTQLLVNMTSPQAHLVHEMSFVPCNLVQVRVGCLLVFVYPKIEPSMPVFERAHTFQVVKSALEPLPVHTCLILGAIGTQLNCSAAVNGLMFNWRSLFDSVWYAFPNLSIVTFHDSGGAEIKTTTIAGNAAIFLPIQDGAKASSHQKDVCFVCVMCNVDFSGIITIPNYRPTVLCVGFYLKLPQTTVAMLDGHNVAYNLTTWHGVAILTTLTSGEVCMLILKPCLQDGPIPLCPANFNLGDANINAVMIRETIHAKILFLGFKKICASIFAQLCPGYSDQPHAVLEHIRQTSTGSDGQPVTATVMKYYQHMLNAACPFAMQACYAISVCNHFIQGLDRTLLTSFR